jgi:hypothetical protein
MTYRVEYLVEATEEDTVCAALDADCDLVTAEWLARARGAHARVQFNAEGFQIRDLADAGRIVALEMFDDPLGRFHAGDYVVH